jgi:TonB family protein
LHYNSIGFDDLSLSDTMPSNRPTLKLDEQSFQNLLSAAFTIQEHYSGRISARPTQTEPQAHTDPEVERQCQDCGALMPAHALRCGICDLNEFRPGEQVQPDWAKMLLESQQQGSWLEPPFEGGDGGGNLAEPHAADGRPLRIQEVQDFASHGSLASPITPDVAKEPMPQERTDSISCQAFHLSALAQTEAKSESITEASDELVLAGLAAEDSKLTIQQLQLSARHDSSSIDPKIEPPDGASLDAMDASAELLKCLSDGFLQRIVEHVLKAIHATGAAIAIVEEEGNFVCRAVAGSSAFEIGTRINIGSGPSGVCASSGTMQLWSSAELESREDAAAYRKLGVRAVMVAPILYQDRLLGMMEVLSERPFAFGMRDLQALQDLAETITAPRPSSAEFAKANTGDELLRVRAASVVLSGRSKGHLPDKRVADKRNLALYAFAVIACVVIGLYSTWLLFDRNPAKGKVTLISIVPTVSSRNSHTHVAEGTLLYSVDPTFPVDALRQRIQGEVVLQVRVSKDGFVYSARAIRGEPILDQAAVEAVRHWRLSPYRMNDKPSDMAAQITFNFTLVN